MAKISAHGKEVGTLFFLTSAKKYMSDRTILKNRGFGWKIGGKLKAELTPQEAFRLGKEHQARVLSEKPELAAYQHELHANAGMGNRWKLHAAIELMPDDPDGVWSECCDGYGDNVHADIDDIVKLCQLYKNMIEYAKLRAEQNAA